MLPHEAFSEKLADYTKEGSQKYVYTLKEKDMPHELNKIGNLYQLIWNEINKPGKYSDTKEYIVFVSTTQKLFETPIKLQKIDLLILDDFGLQSFDNHVRDTLMDIIEDRFGTKSTIVSSQIPVSA